MLYNFSSLQTRGQKNEKMKTYIENFAGFSYLNTFLTDGNSWIFRLVNCSDSPNGRKCHSTNFTIRPEQRDTLKARIKEGLELLILWVRQICLHSHWFMIFVGLITS